MDVLIKGMKMPKEGCKDCLLVKRKGVFDICPFLKREVDGNVERGGKPLACPLIEVPTPHGRLIDGDMLESLIYERLSDLDYKADTFDILRTVQEMSTIIGTEEKEK